LSNLLRYGGPIVGIVTTFFVSFFILLPRVHTTSINGDETGWIVYGRSYADLLIRGDFDRGSWEMPEAGTFGEINLHLGKLLIGLPVEFYRIHRELPVYSGTYQWELPLKVNKAIGGVPPQPLLLLGRGINVVFAALICTLILVAVSRLVGAIAGLVATTSLLFNELFAISATRAMTDMAYNFFLLLALIGVVGFSRSHKANFHYLSALAVGIAGGLAACVKFAGFPLTGLLLFLVVVLSWWLEKIKLREAVMSLAIAFTAGMATIYGLTPNYWPNFSKFNPTVIGREVYEIVVKQPELPGPNGEPTSFLALLDEERPAQQEILVRYPALASTILPLTEYFRLPWRWEKLYAQMRADKVLPRTTMWNITFNYFLQYRAYSGEILLLGLSIGLCAWHSYVGLRGRTLTPSAILLIFTSLHFLFVLLNMKMEFDRYYLPSVIGAALIIGCGTGLLVRPVQEWILARWRKQNSLTDAAP